MTAPLTHNISEAAERLGGPFTVDWLRKHIKAIPHVKGGTGKGRGGRIAFTDAHLTQIVQMFTVEPTPVKPADTAPVGRRRSA